MKRNAPTSQVPDLCPDLTEDEVEEEAFRLIFAFDEMITFGGYKVHITLNGIQGNLDMNSANENAFVESRMRQLEEAKRTARDNERRISEARRNHMMPTGFGGDGVSSSSFQSNQQQFGGTGFSGGGDAFNNSSASFRRSNVDRYGRRDPYADEDQDSSSSRSKTPSRRGLKLGKKKKKGKFDKFARQMAKEENIVLSTSKKKAQAGSSNDDVPAIPAADLGDIHLSVSESLKIRCERDGTCDFVEVKGTLVLTAHSAEGRSAQVQLNRGQNLKDFKLQPNPNVNRKAWSKQSVITPKNEQKLFPIGKGVPVLRWRMEKRNEEDTPYLPLSVTAWPEAGSKSTVVNVEYNLEREDMTLHNFVITIPLRTSETPEILEVDGTTRHNRREETLEWYVNVVDSSNASGSINFEIAQPDEDAFFPMQVSFQSKKPLIELAPGSITSNGKPLKCTSEAILRVASFDIGSEE